MARSAQEIREQLDALREAKGQGVVSVSYEGRTVTYRNFADMRAAEADLEKELAEAEDRVPASGRRFASYRSGY